MRRASNAGRSKSFGRPPEARAVRRRGIERDEFGVPRVAAETYRQAIEGLGYCHAFDRGLQMLLMRLLGRGEISAHLDASDDALASDVFFRRMNWWPGTREEAEEMPDGVREIVAAYCDGVNARFAERVPWELRLLGYRPEPWTIDDCLLIARMAGYLTLSQSQAEIERLLVEMVQAGVARARLEELFPGLLGELDEELIRNTMLRERIVPASVRWNAALPRMMASNNWVIAGSKTASGKPMLANDPHLEANRLPNVWYEAVLATPDRYVAGATMPGLPGVMVGRNPDVAWGATYAFMDSTDHWIEHCRSGACRRETPTGDEIWEPMQLRREVIRRKGKADHVVAFYENEHGVVECDPEREGLYLASRWSGSGIGAVSLACTTGIWSATNVEGAMDCMGRLETAFNWVFADRHGNIGYQMSGLMPRRRDGALGLVPLPGWKSENDWQGYVPHTELPRAINPPQGFFVTANDDLNAYGQAKPINMPMGDYRARRIAALLDAGTDFTLETVSRMHYDVYSLQAERFMVLIGPLLPDTEAGRTLRDWNLEYLPESLGATLFEQVYRELLREVFGAAAGFDGACDFLSRETGTFVDFYANFDRVLFSEQSCWFGPGGREAAFRAAIERGLSQDARPWGETNRVTLTNIFFRGKLPKVLGFDRGPVPIRGGRATVHQGQIYRNAGRATSFIPGLRMIADMAEEGVHTHLVGGPSDRRLSKWYDSDTRNWLESRYKHLRARRHRLSTKRR
jgi:penicillin amidase